MHPYAKKEVGKDLGIHPGTVFSREQFVGYGLQTGVFPV